MDSLKKNKFLSSYLAIVVLGVLGLGYLLFSSLKANKAAAEAFDAEQSAVTALQNKPLFPNAANLQARQAQVEAFATTVTQLQQGLLAAQPKLDTEASSDKFQSTLTETLNAVKGQAEMTKLNSRAGADFDLGFGKYLENLPPRQAVPDLLFQLGAVDALVRTMLTDRVASIDDISRTELDVESAKADAPAAAKPAARGAAKKPAGGPPAALAEDLVLKRYPMEVRFTGSPRSVQDVLNHIAASKDYFYAVRSLRVENERKVGPPKGVAPQSSSSEESQKDSEVVLGGEKVSVWLALDLIRFLDPSVAAADTKKTAAK